MGVKQEACNQSYCIRGSARSSRSDRNAIIELPVPVTCSPVGFFSSDFFHTKDKTNRHKRCSSHSTMPSVPLPWGITFPQGSFFLLFFSWSPVYRSCSHDEEKMKSERGGGVKLRYLSIWMQFKLSVFCTCEDWGDRRHISPWWGWGRSGEVMRAESSSRIFQYQKSSCST